MDPSRRGVLNGAGAASGSSSGHKSSSISSSGKQGSSGTSAYQPNNNTKKSSRMKETVNYSDKKHFFVPDLEEDIAHPVAHRQLNELEEHVNDLHESWETESIFEEILEDITEDRPFTDGRSHILRTKSRRSEFAGSVLLAKSMMALQGANG